MDVLSYQFSLMSLQHNNTTSLLDLPPEILQQICLYIMEGRLRLQLNPQPQRGYFGRYSLEGCFKHYRTTKRTSVGAWSPKMKWTGASLTPLRLTCRSLEQQFRDFCSIKQTRVVELPRDMLWTNMNADKTTLQTRPIKSPGRIRIVPVPFQHEQFTTITIHASHLRDMFENMERELLRFPNVHLVILTGQYQMPPVKYQSCLQPGNAGDENIRLRIIMYLFYASRNPGLYRWARRSMNGLEAEIRLLDRDAPDAGYLDVTVDLKTMKLLRKISSP